MSRRRHRPKRWRAIVATAAAGAFAIAPAAAAQRPQQQLGPIVPETFTTPDGSRFVLVPTPGQPQVHWSVATLADAAEEPAGLAGLATAVQNASLGGTWRSGSRDVAAERAALTALDREYADLLATPGDPQLMAQVAERQQVVDRLGDRSVWARVLAAAPAFDPRVSVRDSVALFELTTVPSAIAEVGALLVERREQQALRGLPRHWLDEVARRQNAFDADPLAPVHAELLALAIPDHPESRAAGRPGSAMPRRAQAMAVWEATQHPTRTVHVLLGGFDPRAARQALTAAFAATALPTPSPRGRPTPRPVVSLRRSSVPGTGRSMVALAWILPPIADPLVLRLAARWLGADSASPLASRLRAEGRKSATVRCTAPWPVTVDGHSLLLLEIEDPTGTDGLAEFVMESCRELVGEPPAQWELNRHLRTMQSNWNRVTAEPRWLAAETARAALLWPSRQPTLTPPAQVEPRAVHQFLRAILAGQPVIVEAKP